MAAPNHSNAMRKTASNRRRNRDARIDFAAILTPQVRAKISCLALQHETFSQRPINGDDMRIHAWLIQQASGSRPRAKRLAVQKQNDYSIGESPMA